MIRLVHRMNDLAGAHPRYGYRRVCALLQAEGWRVNRKRIQRLWRLEGHRVPPRRAMASGMAELARGEFIDRRENVLIVGNPGTGKTHLAIALSAAACARGYRVRFFRVTELVTSLIEARDERGLLGLRARLAKLDLLVLDELGYVPASKVGAELLFDVIQPPTSERA